MQEFLLTPPPEMNEWLEKRFVHFTERDSKNRVGKMIRTSHHYSAVLSLPTCQDADCGLSLRNIHLRWGVHSPAIVSDICDSGNSRVILFQIETH